MSAIKKILKALRPSIAEDAKRLVRLLARRSLTRRWLNVLYRALPYSGKKAFHTRFSKLFCGSSDRLEPSDWIVRFLGKKISLPITGERSWLEWDAAMSILGHEAEILQTYETLIRSARRPIVFFDVGANYGMHSLLFLAQGIRTVSFEPNPDCSDFFMQVCAHNHISPDMRALALGDRAAKIELCYPANETWLGTVVPAVRASFKGRADLKVVEIDMLTLDLFVDGSGLRPDLIKIDTEGNESAVIRGALKTISEARPVIIFECSLREERAPLWGLFRDANYAICSLPVTSPLKMERTDESSFQANKRANFIAFPAETPF